MRRSRLQIAEADIVRYFDKLPVQVFRQSDLARHLSRERGDWGLSESTGLHEFIEFLLKSGRLSQIVFPFPKSYKTETRYSWGTTSIFQIMLTLKPSCYFSHHTAVRIHDLTQQHPEMIYVNDEQPQESVSSGELTQDSINSAFRRRARVSKYIAKTESFRVCIVNGKNTGKLGVVEQSVADDKGMPLGRLRFTDLERTLIDIAVRPAYAGGVPEVAKAYRSAKGRLSVSRLAGMLEDLKYIYPYHQAVGFYLEQAGYKSGDLDSLRKLPMEFDFYLAHGMKQKRYEKDWRLYVPKDF